MIGSKVGLMCLLNDYWQYRLLNGDYPLDPNPSGYSVLLWMRARCKRLGSCNSHKSWHNAITWWCEINLVKPVFVDHDIFKIGYPNMKKLYKRPVAQRLPLRFDWIIDYLRAKGVTPNTWRTIDLELLRKCWFLIFYFFSLTRPVELIYSNKTENKEWEIITTGLLWEHITHENTSGKYIDSYLQVVIPWYKNQKHREVPKVMYMSPPICGNKECDCCLVDFVEMFLVLKKRSQKAYVKLKQQATLKRKKSAKMDKMLKNCNVIPSNYVLVSHEGIIYRYSHISAIINDLKNTLNLQHKKQITPYSARIGSVSLCRQQEIDVLKIIKYVIWSVESLPHISARYMAIGIDKLKILPFEMIHGRNRPGKVLKNNRMKKLLIQGLWTKEIEQAFFADHF